MQKLSNYFMSRIGKKQITIPPAVKVEIEGQKVKVTGPKGSLERKFPRTVTVEVKDAEVFVLSKAKTKSAKAMYGTARALLANMIHGVSEGWLRSLELVGTGYRAEGSDKKLTLVVGYSHPVEIVAPEGISFKIEKTEVTIEGIDKELVGQTAAKIRAIRPPEPYKGKGIKYKDEIVRRKPGKAAKAQGAAA